VLACLQAFDGPLYMKMIGQCTVEILQSFAIVLACLLADPIAMTSLNVPFCIDGITFSRPIFAVLSTPHLSLRMMMLFCSG
jgi:hypothetical protein